MPFSWAVNSGYSDGSGSLSGQLTGVANVQEGANVDLTAAVAGSLTTRTDNDTGVITTTAAHGFTTSDKLALFWDGGKRYNVTITAVTSTTISIDVGSGTNLPAAATAINCSIATQYTIGVDVSAVDAFFLGGTRRFLIVTNSLASAGDVFDVGKVGATNPGYAWGAGSLEPSPLTTDITSLFIANGETLANTVNARFMIDTP